METEFKDELGKTKSAISKEMKDLKSHVNHDLPVRGKKKPFSGGENQVYPQAFPRECCRCGSRLC